MRRRGQCMTREHRKAIERSRRRQRGTWGGTYSMRGMVQSPNALAKAIREGNAEVAATAGNARTEPAKQKSMLVRFVNRLMGRS